jgi:plastocyanin
MKSVWLLLLCLTLSGGVYAEEKKVFTAVVDKDGVQRVAVSGSEYYFDPNYIIVKVKVPVEMTVKKEPSIAPHNIVISASEAGMDVRESLSTEPKVIRFTPAKTGKYPFYCDKKLLFLKSHKDRGMEGIIEVVE